MRKKLIVFLPVACFVLLTILSTRAFSHPHVFITQKVKIVFDDQGLAGFNVYWIFDDMFTAAIIGDYDKNRNKNLEKDEVSLIEKEAFSYLANYNYFTFIKINGKPFPVKTVRDFWAALLKNKLIYTFFVPCHVPAANSVKKIKLASYDPTYYTSLAFDKPDMVSIENPGALKVKTILKKDSSERTNQWTLFLDFWTK